MTRSTISLLTKAVVALVSVAALLCIFRAWALVELLQATSLVEASAIDLGGIRVVQKASGLLSSVQSLLLPVGLALLLLLAFWFRALDPSKRGSGKTLLAFLLPVANLVIPFIWLRELARVHFDEQHRTRAHLVDLCWAAGLGWQAAVIWAVLTWWRGVQTMSSTMMDFTIVDRRAKLAEALRNVVTAGLVETVLALAFLVMLGLLVWNLGSVVLAAQKRAEAVSLDDE